MYGILTPYMCLLASERYIFIFWYEIKSLCQIIDQNMATKRSSGYGMAAILNFFKTLHYVVVQIMSHTL